MKFDYCLGNPPYQTESVNTAWSGQIYNLFMDGAQLVANKVLMITPGRFLFNAGKTPSEWNKKMLNSTKFKVLKYYMNSEDVFFNTTIEGGIAIHYYNNFGEYEPIVVFSANDNLGKIIKKVRRVPNFESFSDIIYPYSSYAFSVDMPLLFPKLFEELPNKRILASNLFEKFENILFFEKKPTTEATKYIKILGRKNNSRVFMWVKDEYIDKADNFEYFKVFIPAANGSTLMSSEDKSALILGVPIVGNKYEGHNQTFMSIGKFENIKNAENCLKYIKTKFLRLLVASLKVTQNGKKSVYANVPLQDFTENSDIDWSKSIHEIDLQLYKKYDLNEQEISFIEEKIKEME